MAREFTVGIQAAYNMGWTAYEIGKSYEDMPTTFTEVEEENWQEGFDDAALSDPSGWIH